MSDFIEKLPISIEMVKIHIDMLNILNMTSWEGNQISLKCRLNSSDKWKDGIGSLYNRQTNIKLADETEFTIWNLPNESPIRGAVENLESTYSFKSGRIRIMKLSPKTGLSVHKDDEVRYHLVIKTNPFSYICLNHSQPHKDNSNTSILSGFHLPSDGHWYKIDTTQTHWVYNGGFEDRIHLVVNKLK